MEGEGEGREGEGEAQLVGRYPRLRHVTTRPASAQRGWPLVV
jgi:hypothetical protein